MRKIYYPEQTDPFIFFIFFTTFFYAYLKSNFSQNEIILQYFLLDRLFH